MIMAKQKDSHGVSKELITLQPNDNITVIPPNSGVVGSFLEQTANMFRARSMRLNGLLNRVNETGQRMEALLRRAAERAEAAESALEQNLLKEGLLLEIPDKDPNEE
jgi:hypothetical protein